MDLKKKKKSSTPSRVKQELLTPSRLKQEPVTPARMKQEATTPRSVLQSTFPELFDENSLDYWENFDKLKGDLTESKGRKDDSESESDMSSEGPPGKPRFKAPVLHQIVSSPQDFDTIEEPGPLTAQGAKQDEEYFIFRFPKGMIKPDDLINTKLTIGGKGPRNMLVKNKTYKVSTYAHTVVGDTPTLFLPDDYGRLRQVNLEISGQVVLQDSPLDSIEAQQTLNINDVRRKTHKLPEIKERNFFGSCSTSSCNQPPAKKMKTSKKAKRRSKEI